MLNVIPYASPRARLASRVPSPRVRDAQRPPRTHAPVKPRARASHRLALETPGSCVGGCECLGRVRGVRSCSACVADALSSHLSRYPSRVRVRVRCARARRSVCSVLCTRTTISGPWAGVAERRGERAANDDRFDEAGGLTVPGTGAGVAALGGGIVGADCRSPIGLSKLLPTWLVSVPLAEGLKALVAMQFARPVAAVPSDAGLASMLDPLTVASDRVVRPLVSGEGVRRHM